MGVSLNGGTQQPLVFPTENDRFRGVLGVPPFKETPIYVYIMYYDTTYCIWVHISSRKKTCFGGKAAQSLRPMIAVSTTDFVIAAI